MSKRTVQKVVDQTENVLEEKQPFLQSIVESIGGTAPEFKNPARENIVLYVAAYILSKPNYEITIFTTGRRASRKIIALVQQMVVKLVGTSDVVTVFNQENLEVKSVNKTTSRCCSYPSKVQLLSDAREARDSYIMPEER